eukprot:TRINITY_DN1352_c0_g1_i4.p1 TRINITY_DN1352_c0_g1~~TRINITY_DN1352_c0_g1_i4.p1  ORF type:complete len:479 (+),score=76.85 TRINITY_DN1352_c0_g1_i4:929-2365(+)
MLGGFNSFLSNTRILPKRRSSQLLSGSPSKKKKWTDVAKTVGATLTTAVGLVLYFDEGSRRSAMFWSAAYPIYLHYRYVQWKTNGEVEDVKQQEFNKLHDLYSPIAEQMTTKLKGFYLKQAQLMSVLDDFLPPQYMKWCKKMQDEVPTEFPPGKVRDVVEKSLGRPISDIFLRFDDIPRGAASIGQVHYAVLRDGREVAVKIQFPNMEQRFRSDLKTIKRFSKIAMPQHVQPLEEIENQFLTEFDYVGEAKNLQEIHDNIMPTWSKKVAVPQPIMELCTKDILVMEYLHGIKLVDGIRNSYRKYAEMQGKTMEEYEEEEKRKILNGTKEFDSATSQNIKVTLYRAYIKSVDTILNSLKFMYNYSFGLITRNKYDYTWTELPLNLAYIMELLHRVHAHQVFTDGAFNGDPHPGNILLMNDGRLGLIDYGQVKHIDLQTRIHCALLIMALDSGDPEKVADVLQHEMHMKGKHNNRHIAYR